MLKLWLCSSVILDLLNYEVWGTWIILWNQIIIPGVSILNSLWTTQIFSNLKLKLCESLFKDLLNCDFWDNLNIWGKKFLFHLSQIQNVANCAILSVESLWTFFKINNFVQCVSDFFESLKTKWLVLNLFHVTQSLFGHVDGKILTITAWSFKRWVTTNIYGNTIFVPFVSQVSQSFKKMFQIVSKCLKSVSKCLTGVSRQQ